MAVTCQELLQIFAAQKMKLCAGGSGLGHAVRWFHAIESVEDTEFLQPDEIVFFTGVSIGDDDAAFRALLHGILMHHGAGIVVNLGKYIHGISEAACAFAEAEALPLFVLPWSVRLGGVTQALGTRILSERAKEKNIRGLIKKCLFSSPGKAAMLDLSLLYHRGLPSRIRVLAIAFRDFPQEQASLVERVESAAERVLREAKAPALYTWNGNEMRCLLPPLDDARGLAEKFTAALGEIGLVADYGLGSVVEDVRLLSQSHQEAHFALRIARGMPQHFATYEDAGVFRLFARMEDDILLSTYAEESLAALSAYDQKNHTAFTQTLDVYLMENEDTAATCARLFIHRNTLAYRLKRIEEITGRSMGSADARLDFRLAFKIRKYLALMSEQQGLCAN